MPETYLQQPGFTYSACQLFSKNKKRIQKFIETGDLRYIYQNELVKRTFNMTQFMKILRTASDKVLRDKAFNIAKNPKVDGNEFASLIYEFF